MSLFSARTRTHLCANHGDYTGNYGIRLLIANMKLNDALLLCRKNEKVCSLGYCGLQPVLFSRTVHSASWKVVRESATPRAKRIILVLSIVSLILRIVADARNAMLFHIASYLDILY